MKSYVKLILIVLSLQTVNILSQSNYSLDGYVQNMQTVWKPSKNLDLILSNSVSNRFNLSLYPSQYFSINASLRNIFDYGDFVSLVPFYSKFVTFDEGYLDMTEEIYSGNSHILYTNIDRLNVKYSLSDLEIQVGRQRINWGINSVWTPNDIFNSFSFINFDYSEKPGSDALRLQYYFGFASSVEFVSKINSDKKLTLAAKLQFNKWEYDFQLIGGRSEADFIVGGGWSGSILGAGFTGESTYFIARLDDESISDIFVSSIGGNYMFSNDIFLSIEFLYNSIGKVDKSEISNNIFNLDYSAKKLSPSKYSVFTQILYPLTPLINISAASMINPTDHSMFFNPNVEFSLNEDVYLLLSGQFFIGENLTEWGDYGQFYYLRIKWNF